MCRRADDLGLRFVSLGTPQPREHCSFSVLHDHVDQRPKVGTFRGYALGKHILPGGESHELRTHCGRAGLETADVLEKGFESYCSAQEIAALVAAECVENMTHCRQIGAGKDDIGLNAG